MFCIKCGDKMPEGACFCPDCGQKSETAANPDRTEKVKAEFPAGNPAAPPPALAEMKFQGVGIRFAGLIVDTILLFIPFYLIGSAVARSSGEVTSEGWALSGGPAFLFFLIMLVIAMGYYTLFESAAGGTPGKLICGMRVLDEKGVKCSFRQAFIRNILRAVDGLFVYLVGAVLIWKSPKCQRLGDRAAGTVVVKKTGGKS